MIINMSLLLPVFQMKKTHIIYLFLVTILLVAACDKSKSDTQTKKENALPEKKLTSTGASNLIPPLFDETSITRDYLNIHQGLKWKNNLGDWVDAEGTPQGDTAWATAEINPNTKGSVSLDVTRLIKEQQGKKNQLLVFSSPVPVKISSREGKHPPILVITLENTNAGQFTLKPTLDCTIAKSTHKNINTEILQFDAADFKSFIQFHLPRQKIKKAILQLWPIKIYGTGNILVFNLNYDVKKSKLISGIAGSSSSYAQLKNHPSVLFVDTFDDTEINPAWFLQDRLSPGHIENGYLTGEIYPNKNHSTVNRRYYFKKNLGKEPTEIYFRYSVRFHKDFNFSTQGGKLPGLAGTYNSCGWGGRKPGPDCPGWSARMHWQKPIQVGPYKGMIPIGVTIAHLDQKDYYEDFEKWQAFCLLDKWCELEEYVKINTPGKKDGIVRGFHNGKLVFERKNLRFRNRENIKIEDAWMLIYHGGTGFPTKPIHADIDNIVISKSYIGMLKGQKSNISTSNNNYSTITDSINSLIKKKNIEYSNKIIIPQAIRNFSNQEFKKNSRLISIPINTAINLGDFSCTNPKGDRGENCKRATDYSGMVYDQNNHQVLMFGGGHSTTFTDSVFIFNFRSLKWKEDYPPTPCTSDFMKKENYLSRAAWSKGPRGPYPRPISRHTYDQLAVVNGLPELILLATPNGYSLSCPPRNSWEKSSIKIKQNPKISHYNLIEKKWSFSDEANPDAQPYRIAEYTATEFDPVSGAIILLGRYGLYLYDPYSRIKYRLIDYSTGGIAEDLGYANELVYYPPDDRMYYFNRNTKSVWEVILNRDNFALSTVIKLNVKGDYPKHPEPGYAYDSVNEVIGGAVFNNKFYIFDPKTNTWSNQEISGGKPGNMEFHAIAYDPVDNVFIFLTKGFRTWAYRYK